MTTPEFSRDYTYSKAEDAAMEAIVIASWEDYCVGEISGMVSFELKRVVTNRQIWGAHQRLMKAKGPTD